MNGEKLKNKIKKRAKEIGAQPDLNKTNLIRAIHNTCKRRESLYILEELQERYDFIKTSIILQAEWDKYKIAHLYARDIQYADIMKNINLIIEELEKEAITT